MLGTHRGCFGLSRADDWGGSGGGDSRGSALTSWRDVLEGRARWAADQSDAHAWLRSLPDACVHCWVTSPPYYGLRSYLPAGHPDKVHETGSEDHPDRFIAKLVEVFAEVRRVLRSDGVLWLNLGDSYASDWPCSRRNKIGNRSLLNGEARPSRLDRSVKEGDLLNMPHRVAAALQADGWYWRQTIIWAKRSPMPESIGGVRWERCRVKVAKKLPPTQAYKASTARNGALNRDCINGEWIGGTVWASCPGCPKCSATNGWILRRGRWRNTTAHEYLFMLTPGERYFCDGEAAREPAVRPGDVQTFGGNKGRDYNPSPDDPNFRNGHHQAGRTVQTGLNGRNPRSVWTLSSESYKGAHFATFPSELPRRCIEASTSAAGCCPACGSCWAPMVERERVATQNAHQPSYGDADTAKANGWNRPNVDPGRHIQVSRILGYRPTCSCPAAEPVPCIVGDMYTGSGTVAQVATHMGRRFIGCELNPDYLPLIEQRVVTVPRCLRPKKAKPPVPVDSALWPLFEGV